jgi:hypothetical protein
MKFKILLTLLAASTAALTTVARADQLVPAGSVLNCTIAEGKVSSKTEHVGDPILCTVSHTSVYGNVVFPFGSYLIGHFAAYKDPGHFVGKGWMELDFDRLVIQPDTIVPISARVVQAAKYPVDGDGKIHGTGHAVRDTVEWLIPVLWPIDLINLPRRGPRPELKPESKLVLKVMEDFGIPTPQENAVRNPAVASRVTPDEPTYQSLQPRQPMPVQQSYAAPQQQQYAPQQQYPPQRQYYAPRPQPTYYAPRPMYQQPQVVVQFVQPQPPPVMYTAPVMYAPPVMMAPAYSYGYRMGPYGPY